MALLPSSVENEIVRQLFSEAEAVGWQLLPVTARTAQYKRWMDSPEVGAKLQEFMTAAQARVWIKDGPMKEFSRAVHGFGKYAALISSPAPSVEELVKEALGPEWSVLHGSLRSKPMRVSVADGQESAVFAWGPPTDLKHLVWAGLVSVSRGDTRRWILCSITAFVAPMSADAVVAAESIAKRCGFDFVTATTRGRAESADSNVLF